MGQARRTYTKRADWWADRAYLKGNLARPAGSPARIAAGRQVSETKMAWCPPELREEYRGYTSRGLRASEAREVLQSSYPDAFARWQA